MVAIPNHVALIPDGNRRWAKKHFLPSRIGHEKGYMRVREFVAFARNLGIAYVTLWVFSTENWKRETSEISDLMDLIKIGLEKIHEDAKKEKTRVVHLGRRDRLDKELLQLIEKVEEETKAYTGFCLCIALDYGGEDELIRAGEKLKEEQVATETITSYLDTAQFLIPSVDLVIRTGGEKRTSGFMPIQTAYAEWVFEEKFLPDFDETAFTEVVKE